MVDVAYILGNKLNFNQVVFWYAYSKLTKKLTENNKALMLTNYKKYLKNNGDSVTSTEALLFLFVISRTYSNKNINDKFSKLILKYYKYPKDSYEIIKKYYKLLEEINCNNIIKEVLFKRLAIADDIDKEKKYLKFYSCLEGSRKKIFNTSKFIEKNYDYIKYYEDYLQSDMDFNGLEKLIQILKDKNFKKCYFKRFIAIFLSSRSDISWQNVDILFEMKELITYPFWKRMYIRAYDFLRRDSSGCIAVFVYEEYNAGIYDSRLNLIEQKLSYREIVINRAKIYNKIIKNKFNDHVSKPIFNSDSDRESGRESGRESNEESDDSE